MPGQEKDFVKTEAEQDWLDQNPKVLANKWYDRIYASLDQRGGIVGRTITTAIGALKTVRQRAGDNK